MAQEVAGSNPVGHPLLMSRPTQSNPPNDRPITAIAGLALLCALIGFFAANFFLFPTFARIGELPPAPPPVPTSSPLAEQVEDYPDFVEVQFAVAEIFINPPPPPLAAVDPVSVTTVDHVVRPGESLSLIAQRYGVTVAELAAINDIKDVSLISVDQVLQIPQ